MKTSPRPELREPVAAFAARLEGGERAVPLADLAALFGAGGDLLDQVAGRGDIAFTDDSFSNDGPELVLPAGRVELEIPSLIRGKWSGGEGSFTLTFPLSEFAPRACARIAFLRKCFELKELRATPNDMVLDFGSDVADRRYTF
jgi:hypothetical protein